MTNPTHHPNPTYPHPTGPNPVPDDREPYYGPHPGYAPAPAAYLPSWSIPAQRGYPGPGLHPAVLGGPPAPPPREGTSGLAIVALTLGILAVVALVVAIVTGLKGDVAGVVGIVLAGIVLLGLLLGVIALVQLRGSAQTGLPHAIVGISLSAIVAVLLVIGVVAAATASTPAPTVGPAAPTPAPGTTAPNTTAPATPTSVRGVPTSTNDLKVGDCIQTLPQGSTVRQVDVVACTAPHQGEVFYEFNLTGRSFPGDQQIQNRASRTCNDQYRTVAPSAFADNAYNLAIYSPTAQSWAAGSRGVTCIATTRTAVAGSVIGR